MLLSSLLLPFPFLLFVLFGGHVNVQPCAILIIHFSVLHKTYGNSIIYSVYTGPPRL
jgi:hypothetical protein